jgi:hypothetical protein
MQRLLKVCTIFCLMIVLGSCRGKPGESVTQVENGPFKLLVRSQEFHNSGIRNVDVCVAETSDRKFPNDEAQCFLHGFDFSGLSAKWRAQREIEVSFSCATITYFKNFAIVSPHGSVPVGFHVILLDECDAGSKAGHGR